MTRRCGYPRRQWNLYSRPMDGKSAELIGCALGYAIGSIPFGLWMGRATTGRDVRDQGSGSMGTTNVLRMAGPVVGAAVFGLDVAKGTAAVLGARALGGDRYAQSAAGIAAVVGHSWPALARFRGGKSVATAFGGLLVISPAGSVAALAGGLGALGASRRMSVGSLAAASAATVVTGLEWGRNRNLAPFLFTAGVTTVIVFRHAANIRRLLSGTEPTVSFRRRRAAIAPPPT